MTTEPPFTSRPEPGTYNIFSRVLNARGQRLAMTFNGNGEPVTVTPFDALSTKQRWVLEDYDSQLQHFKPHDDRNVEAGWGSTIYTLPLGNYVWNVSYDNGYLIKDGGRSISWSINSASNDTPVVPIQDSTGEKQRWIFHKVDSPLD